MKSIEELLNKLPDSVRKSLYKDAVDLKPIKQQILDSFAELRTNLDAACDLNKSLEQALKQSEENCRKQVEDLKSEYKKCHTFHQIQSLAVSWSYKNFGEHYGTGYRNLLGIAEEVGELCHAQLKGEQGIRHTPEEISQLKKDAVGDIIIFLCNYCDSQNLSLHECVNIAWNEIKDRNWQYDNLTKEERK